MKPTLTILLCILSVIQVYSQTSNANRVKPVYWIFPYTDVNLVERISYHRTVSCDEPISNSCYPIINESYFITNDNPDLSNWLTIRANNRADERLSFSERQNRSWESLPSINNLILFANDTMINNVLIDQNTLAALSRQPNDEDDIPVARSFQINFQDNDGRNLNLVTTRIQNWVNQPNSSYPSFLNSVNLLMNNPNLNIDIEGHASNSWNGIDCSLYTTTQSICDSLSLIPGLADGDFDGGGETNGDECANNRLPLNRRDDVLAINPNTGLRTVICAATNYNNQLAQLRMQAAVIWFQNFYPTVVSNGVALPPNRIRQSASGISNNATNNSIMWNQDQNIIFRIR